MHEPHDDRPLQEDLALLTGLFEDVLLDLSTPEVHARVMALTEAAQARRRGSGSFAALQALVAACPPHEAADVVRAFAQGFTHHNLAERVHRLRRRRDAQLPDASPQPGSLLAVAQGAQQEGASADALVQAASKVRLQPVFTAHPTEATRCSLLRKQQRMAQALLAPVLHGGSPLWRRSRDHALKAEMAATWQTETLTDAPTVADEVAHVTFHLTEVLYPIVPSFYDGMVEALRDAGGDKAAERYRAVAEDSGPWVRFGTWVGGDMDGNPNVGPQTLTATLQSQRRALVAAYLTDLAHLADRLSQSTSRVGVSAEVQARLEIYDAAAPGVIVPSRHRDMPYRRLLAHLGARLQATAAGNPDGMSAGIRGYTDSQALLDDLGAMARSLDAHSGAFGGGFAVRRVMRRVTTFGLHLAALDVRQDSLVHRQAVADLLGDSTLVEADAAVRTARYTEALQQAMAGKPPWPKELLAQAQSVPGPLGRMLAVCASLIQARATFGAASIGLYIISMAQHVDDVLAVLLLAHAAGLTEPDGEGGLRVPLQIAPLFETVPDLERAAIVCEALFAHPLCRAHIRSQSDRQEIMLGYSDSNKESGLVASRAALLAAEEALVAVAARHGITLRLFHGRGGTVSRGGSKPRQAILTSADPSCDLRITEQGEIISAKYGLEELALRTLELMGGALLERQLRPEPAGVPARFRAALEVCAAASRQAYRQLVVQTPGFFEYFNLATPIDVITRLRIGSRPPSRRACNGLEDLRAIPWVFAWMQNRQMLPAWYGLGQGLAACSEQFGPDHLCGMYARWPFFRQLLDDAAMGLAKCDMQVGALYARLAGPSHEPIWRTIAQSFDDTVAQVARVTGHPELLSHEPVLLRGIQRRNPAIDPMSLMQLDALQKWRASGRTDDGLLRLLMLCVKGIAEGLHNTG